MSRREKRLLKLRQNPNNVSFETLDALLQDFGFVLRSRRGSHCSYRHANSPSIITIVCAKPLDPKYVDLALRMIEACATESD